jgi:hypothetical protein
MSQLTAEPQLVFIIGLAALISAHAMVNTMAKVGEPAQKIEIVPPPCVPIHAEEFVDKPMSVVNQKVCG